MQRRLHRATGENRWTERRIALLRQLYPDTSIKLKDVVDQLGEGLTKSAVCGMAARLGLPKRGPADRPHASGKRATKTKRRRAEPEFRLEGLRPVDVGRTLRVEPQRLPQPAPPRQLAIPRVWRTDACCWPLGEPGTADFCFCGGKIVPGRPYCEEHVSRSLLKACA
jgi:GcrA cell cycle regulator